MDNKSDIVIYGAGQFAKICYSYYSLLGMGERIRCFVITKADSNELFDRPVFQYDQIDIASYKDCQFIVAIKGADNVVQSVKADGIENVVLVDDALIDTYRKGIYEECIRNELDRNKVFLDCFEGSGYGCNSKYVAEYILKHNKDIKMVWDVRDGNDASIPESIKQVVRYSPQYYMELYTSAIVVENNYLDGYPYKRQEQYCIHAWHGSGPYKKVNASLRSTTDEKRAYYKRLYSMVDVFLSNTADNTIMFREAFCSDAEIWESGNPRNDILFEDVNKRNQIREKLGISADEKVLLYVPTFRDNVDTSFRYYDLDMQAIMQAMGSRLGGKFTLLYRFHSQLARRPEGARLYPYAKNVSMYPDIMELLVASDVLITDYSSVMWDFGLQRRPIFLYQNDVDQYTDDRDFYWPISTWPYPIAHTQEELLKEIKEFDEEEYLIRLNDFIAKDTSYDDGQAAQRVVERIEDVLKNPAKYGK